MEKLETSNGTFYQCRSVDIGKRTLFAIAILAMTQIVVAYLSH